jgi:hypothetical protein
MKWWKAVTLIEAAESLGLGGELEAAETDYLEGLRALWEVQDQVNLPQALVTGAVLAALRSDPARAGTLWGAAEAEATRQPRPTTTQNLAEHEAYLDPVRGESFEAARADGRTLSLADGVAYALGDD